jgi:hypothetical protein
VKVAGIPPSKPDDSRRDPIITAAKITAAGAVAAAIIAAVVAIVISHGGSTNILPIKPTGTVSPTAESTTTATGASTQPNPGGGGYLYNIPQTPKNRQETTAITFNGKKYSEPFQLEIPGLSPETYSYALGGHWSKMDLIAENSAGYMGISISIDGTKLGGSTMLPGMPYTDSFSIAGAKELTITLDNSTQFSAGTVLIAGNLYH